MPDTNEQTRLQAHEAGEVDWKEWGPYLSERAWGTVREDYSPDGTAWEYFPHDHARSRAYRWNEDGLAGISDREQRLCFALALWNGRDPILKERLFGLTGNEGNHGEDVKEIYFYLDNTPTHSYMRYLYKYPQNAYPYSDLVNENGRRGYHDQEYELADTGIFAGNRYFDVTIDYAKAGPRDILVEIQATNRADQPAALTLLPTLWFRNTWSWGYDAGPMGRNPGRPLITARSPEMVEAGGQGRQPYYLYAQACPEWLFTDNETNNMRLFGSANAGPYVKDGFHRFLIDEDAEAVNPANEGTKAAAVYRLDVAAQDSVSIKLRLTSTTVDDPFANFDGLMTEQRAQADVFYEAIQRPSLTPTEQQVQRQALAGMLWTKQLYYYDVTQWLAGDPGTPRPPDARRKGRNRDWAHLNNFDIISMPDKWEYPWYAAWDLAFHCLPLMLVDPGFAKKQLVLMTRVWYLHPNGQLPAYEWAFGDVNPPVHAWATWHVYKMDEATNGRADRSFLRRVFLKLLLNFTWWVNRKDYDGNNIFQGGFLGLDNVSLFDRSASLPTGGHIDQSDGTAWMGFYCLEMMRIALELAKDDPVYQDMATKFYEHFLGIARAMSLEGHSLWDEEDGFFYDVLHLPDHTVQPLKVRSMVGLMPLLAVETIEPDLLESMPDFERRMHWFTNNRPHLSGNMASIDVPGEGKRILTSILTRERLERVLAYMLDEDEFLSPYGIRSLSKIHEHTPYELMVNGQRFSIGYLPAESDSGLFGGNSNWRGPVWFPINYLIIEALLRFHSYYGDDFRVEMPTGSGQLHTLAEVAQALAERLVKLFMPDEDGRRPYEGDQQTFAGHPNWQQQFLFYEYFHGDNGRGLGASHQTGWTGLVANLLQEFPRP